MMKLIKWEHGVGMFRDAEGLYGVCLCNSSGEELYSRPLRWYKRKSAADRVFSEEVASTIGCLGCPSKLAFYVGT